MTVNINKFLLIFTCIFGFEKVCATEIYPFFLQRSDGTFLEGYFSPPSSSCAPIIFAIQGSSCESALKWHMDLCDQANAFGFGLIAIEKQGISKNGINLLEYHETNCLQKRLEDYVLCLENMDLIIPEWGGETVFWGESEGGTLAASLASQTPQTAAVLLFATGGGMKPREEVKWALRHRLEKHGALQDEIDQYMIFLDDQMDAMILDPATDKQFLGNTYKWWASLLTADEALMSLNGHSLPICLVHGVEDSQIPILSADMAAEALKDANAFTYLRLDGYGHDLDTANVQTAACQWLHSILCGQEQSNGSLVALVTDQSTTTTPLEDWKTDISHYILSLGKGEAHAEAKGSKDSDGNESASASVGVSKETDDWGRFDINAGAGARKDSEGNTKGEVYVEGRWSRGF